MEDKESVLEKIIYGMMTLLGFTKLESRETSKNEVPQISNVYFISHLKDGRQVLEARKFVEVKASPLPYHKERGWQYRSGVHQGYFRCRLGAFQGEIEERCQGDYKFYIFNPPSEVLTGSHRACFTPNGNGRYHIHFRINSNNLDGGIMAVERLLTQSLTRR